MKRKNPRKHRLLVGLTGGIGSGKSTVAKEFEKLGAVLIESDRISREVVRPGAKAWKKIVSSFGKDILTRSGEIDRKGLARIVFRSKKQRALLERITHPEILAQIREDVRGVSGKKVIVIDLPLLFEAGLERMVDMTLVVWAPEKVRRERLRRRDGLTAGEITRRLTAQMPLERKKEQADIVIDNSKTRIRTRGEVKKIWGVLTKAVQ